MGTDEQTHHTFCRICESLCGLEVTTRGEKVVQIKPDDRHVGTAGFACVKGLKQHHLYDNPDRLTYPVERRGPATRRVTWKHAFDRIGSKVAQLVADHGPNSVGMYVGTAAGFSVLHPVFAQGFMTGIGSKNLFSSATQDCANKFAVATHMYGFCFTQPFPDVERTRCLIVVGANPAVSKWSFLQVANPAKKLREIEGRGGRVFFVDPRRTESAKAAGEHVFIRPNTDVFFYLAFLHELFQQGGVDERRAARHCVGIDELRALAAAWTPERAEAVTRVPAAKLRELVSAYRSADGAALYSSTGVNMGTNGSLCFWLQESINAVSGNLDRPGGTLVGKGVIDFPRFGKKNGILTSTDRSRIGSFGAVNDAYPGGILADEILTDGPGKIRALFVTGGNPLLTMANGNRLREAFEKLELLVCLDIQRSETATLAHYVLPCTTPFERPDLPFLFPLMLGMQSKPYIQATRPVVRPKGESRDEASIYLELARASGLPIFGSAVAQRALEAAATLHSVRHREEQPGLPQERLLSALLRVTGQGSFAQLLEHTHGRARPQHDLDFLGQRVYTDDGKVHLAPPELLAQAQKLEADYAAELGQADRLKLITKRQITTHNSWTHNYEGFVPADGRDTNYLYVHPEDAERFGLSEGSPADVSSSTATVRITVRLSSDLMPGTVALPHGWGHQHARGLTVASRTRGVNVNVLAADGPDRLERVSGMAHLTGIVVDVQPARGPIDAQSWSGLPQDRYEVGAK